MDSSACKLGCKRLFEVIAAGAGGSAISSPQGSRAGARSSGRAKRSRPCRTRSRFSPPKNADSAGEVKREAPREMPEPRFAKPDLPVEKLGERTGLVDLTSWLWVYDN
jgi:hypothetical protein